VACEEAGGYESPSQDIGTKYEFGHGWLQWQEGMKRRLE